MIFFLLETATGGGLPAPPNIPTDSALGIVMQGILYIFFLAVIALLTYLIKFKPQWDKANQDREDARSKLEQEQKMLRAEKYGLSLESITESVERNSISAERVANKMDDLGKLILERNGQNKIDNERICGMLEILRKGGDGK